jgi:hypothetical protein
MARLSQTYFGFGAAQIDALAGQKADSIVGMVLVVIAFLVGAVSLAVVPDGLKTFASRGAAVAAVAVLCGSSYLVLETIGSAIQKSERLAVGRLLTARELSDMFRRGQLKMYDVPSLKVYANTLLDMPIESDEAPRRLLQRLAADVGVQIPENFDYSEVEVAK